MSDTDPFSSAPVEEPPTQEEPPAGDPWATNNPPVTNVAVSSSVDDSEQVRITFKSGSGYEVPWITVDFPSIDVAHDKLSELDRQKKLATIFDITAKASAKFIELVGGSKPSGGGNTTASTQQSNAPQGAQQAPNGEERFCAHGKMQFKSGVSSKTGKPYRMFACTERNRDAQCKAQFLN